MEKKLIKRYVILGILFFLPVIFLIMLYPAQHNYNPLDVVNEEVLELKNFKSTSDQAVSLSDQAVSLKDHITVLGFLGSQPLKNSIGASNLKELVYDKFKGFKKFQVVIVLPMGSENEAELLKNEIGKYEDLRFWHFIFGNENAIQQFYGSLKSNGTLDSALATESVFIIDKELHQRGRLDDRTDNELEKDAPVYDLVSYNTIEVAEIKNKMNDDMRILFTEYRQKRKGNFDSTSRRADDLKNDNND